MENKDRILVVDIAYLTSEMREFQGAALISKLENKYDEQVILIDSSRSNMMGVVTQSYPPLFFVTTVTKRVETTNTEESVKEKLIKLLEKKAHCLTALSKSTTSTTYLLCSSDLTVTLSEEKISFNDEDYPIDREVYDNILNKAKEYRVRKLDLLISAEKQ